MIPRASDRQLKPHFASFMKHLPGMAWIKDSEGRYVYLNDAASEVFGGQPTDICGKRDSDLFPPDTAAVIRANDERVLSGGKTIDGVESFEHVDGTIHHSLVRKFPLNEVGTPDRLIGGMALDITILRRVEEALEQSHQELRESKALHRDNDQALQGFFAQSIDGCFAMMLDEPVRWNGDIDRTRALDYIFEHQRVTMINDAMLAQYGATREDMLGNTPADFFKHDLAHGRELWQQMLDSGKIRLVSDERKHDGSRIWIEGEYIVLYDDEGRVTGHIGVQRDITERKQTDEALRLFRSFMDRVPDTLEVIDYETGRFVDVNEVACRVHGLTRDEYLARTLSEIDPTVAERTWQVVREDVRRNGTKVAESTHRRKDGSLFPVEVNCTFVRLDRDYVLAVVRDISDRKLAEDSIRKSEEQLRLLADALPMRIGYIDKDLRYRFVNRSFADWHGLEPQDVVGRPIAEFWDASLFSVAQPHILSALSGRESQYEIDRIVPGRGLRMVHDITLVPDFAADQTVRGCITLITNITERRHAEAELRENQQRLYLAIQVSNLGTWDWDLQTNEVVYSAGWKRQLGYADDEILDRYEEWECRVHPDDLQAALDGISAYREGRIPDYELDFRLRHKDGSYRNIRSIGGMLRDSDGNPTHLLGCHLDITERKQAEETLRQIVDVTAPTTGRTFFDTLVNSLCSTCQVKFAVAAAIDPNNRHQYQTVAASYRGAIVDNLTYDSRGTPCENVASGNMFIHYASDLQSLFPTDVWIAENDIDSYMGMPLWSSQGELLGLIFLLHDGPIPDPDRAKATLQIVSARCGAELERTRAEEALRESEDRLSEVIRNTPNVAIQWFDIDGRVKLWNEASESMFGYSAAEAVGRTLDELIHTPEEAAAFLKTLATVNRTGQSVGPSEFSFRRRDGETGICLSSIFKIPGDAHSNWFVCMDVDITERKRVEEERRRLEAQVLQSQKLESLGVLAGGIAHDFNNLLTAMLGYSELARTQLPEDSPARNSLKEIEKAAQRAAGLTQQMLAYSGRGAFVIQPMRLDAVVQELTELLQSVVSKKAVLELDLVPATIEGDATQIRQVLMNLITNASDSLEGRAGQIRVRTGLRDVSSDQLISSHSSKPLPGGRYAFVDVEDSGCGMTEETIARIFEPFFTTKFTGRGLGLSAALGIVHAHRGAIHVYSRPGRGSRFTIHWPASSASPLNEPQDSSVVLSDKLTTGTVLVIDDELSIRDITRRVLESNNFRVLSSADGQAGLDVLSRNRNKISAVLLDLTMPSMDGIEFLRRLRDHYSEIPVLVMSGYSEEEVSSRIEGLGVSGVIHKPFRSRDLLSRVSQLFSSE